MSETAYALLASILRYIFVVIIAFILFRVLILSLSEYREDRRFKKRKKYTRSGTLEIVFPEEFAGTLLELTQETVIGRSSSCDIIVPIKNVALRHCVIFERKSGVFIADYGTKTGTFLNGKLLGKHEELMKDGDMICLGEDAEFIIHFDSKQADIIESEGGTADE